ncbi:hypothetical protein J32TS6_25420 [Virgibacillus pantothenticus]|nr:hypothetical protein J32TS6_25420 [Virgibacillus pantothenticus]
MLWGNDERKVHERAKTSRGRGRYDHSYFIAIIVEVMEYLKINFVLKYSRNL